MKAKILAVGTYYMCIPNIIRDPDIKHASVSVCFSVGRSKFTRFISFHLDVMRDNFNKNANAVSEIVTKSLMKNVTNYMDKMGKKADFTDMENVLRLKMPYLLHKAINNEMVVQEFEN